MAVYFVIIVGALALLIYGMKIMSEALQKMAGSQLRHVLSKMTTNRISGVLTGMFTTVAVQSSTATTVMAVSFVNAGLLTLVQAISVIMGANIGTTLTAWIMSAGFSFNITNLVWPAFLIGLLLIYTKKHRYIGDFIFGVAFMFFALGTLNNTGKEMDLAHNVALANFFGSFDPNNPYLPAYRNGSDLHHTELSRTDGHHHGTLLKRNTLYLSWYRSRYGREHRYNAHCQPCSSYRKH